MGASARSRRNIRRTNCRWTQTSQRYFLTSNGSQKGPACCFQALSPDVPTMLLRFSRTTSAARDDVSFRVRAAVRLRGRLARKWIRSAESDMPSRSTTTAVYLQSRTASAVSDGTPFGIRIGLCLAVSIPRSTSSRSCFVTPKSQRRSSMAVPLWRTRGGRTARSLKTCCLIDRLARINRSHRTKGKRALKGARFDGLGMGWHSAKWLRG